MRCSCSKFWIEMRSCFLCQPLLKPFLVMSYRSTNGCREPAIGFDYSALDVQSSPINLDEEFWHAQGELLGDVLRWMTTPRSLAGMGARCCALALYLNPELINKSSLQEISRMRGSPGRAA